MHGKAGKKSQPLVTLVLRAVALAMGVAVAVLSVLGEIEPGSAFVMLGVGLAALSASLLENQK